MTFFENFLSSIFTDMVEIRLSESTVPLSDFPAIPEGWRGEAGGLVGPLLGNCLDPDLV